MGSSGQHCLRARRRSEGRDTSYDDAEDCLLIPFSEAAPLPPPISGAGDVADKPDEEHQ
ncbi:MAG: hypothetical protein K0Q89_2275 [Thermomicrobiales bacterium]|nr:hypothetical protein [Thermomicrobiales bacterium]